MWWLDRPVSNSGRLSQIIMATAQAESWPWQRNSCQIPIANCKQSRDVIVTADSVILDVCQPGSNLASAIVDRMVPDAWIVPLDDRPSGRCVTSCPARFPIASAPFTHQVPAAWFQLTPVAAA